MRGRNLRNVNIATKDLMKMKTSKGILNRFMGGRNLMNVNIAMKDLIKKKTSKDILNRFMRGRNFMNVNIATKKHKRRRGSFACKIQTTYGILILFNDHLHIAIMNDAAVLLIAIINDINKRA